MALEHFLKLSEEKQDNILHCALNEFEKYGYDLASTNRIVKAAGISKGVLFKYFTTKEELFIYIIEKYQSKESSMFSSVNEGLEPFEGIKAILLSEYEYYFVDPTVKQFYSLYTKMVQNLENPVYKKAVEKYDINAMDSFDDYVESIESKQLKPGVTKDIVRTTLTILLRGIRSYYRENLDEVFNEDKRILNKMFAAVDATKRGLFVE